MKETHISRIFVFLLLASFFSGITMSCNEKGDDDEEIAVTPSTVAVKEFYINANTKILTNLDSVFFSIDLKHGVIFNADSLPKGTDVSRLIPSITFMNNMSAVNLTFNKDNLTDTTVNYLTNPTDSIDFSSPVTLSVTAADGVSTFEYQIKVNVHKQNPDSLIWDKASAAILPSRSGYPKQQKTVATSYGYVTLIQEKDDTFTLAEASELNDLPDAELLEITFPFTPSIESLCWNGSFYILSIENELYSSSDFNIWTDTKEKWETIIGPYLDTVLGIKTNSEGIMTHCHYPANDMLSEEIMKPDFPISGRSALLSIETGWSPYPIAYFTGGKDMNGNISGNTWAFDGTTWSVISDYPVPDMENVTMLRYKAYRSTGKPFSMVEFDTWMIYGGILSDGNFNETLYLSADSGITWVPASDFMQLPEEFPLLAGADGFVVFTQMESNISDNWEKVATRNPGRWYKVSYEIDDTEIKWKCPYIYILGGENPGGELSDSIWRAVLSRLTFTPIF